MQPTTVRNPLFWVKIKIHSGMQAVPVNPEACTGCLEGLKVCAELAIAVNVIKTERQKQEASHTSS
jgi:NAD-dependent dihydropyrimidine dehydrogenase PreA subunit